MPDYSKGKIYTIRCRTDDTLIYVGSTIQPLYKRLASHKISSNRERDKNMLIYTTINGNWENWYIELYELYPCSCKEELCKREGDVIRLIGTLNNRIAGRTHKEWYDDNKERHSENCKKWNEANKEYSKEKHAERYENNKEKVLDRVKEWAEKNKEKVAEYKRQYNQRKKQEKQINNIVI